MSPDPIGINGGLRSQGYVEQTTAWIDPLGLQQDYFPPPKGKLPGFPDLRPAKPKTPIQGGGGLRKRWTDKKGNIYEWDSQHGKLEKYNKQGKHQGEFDPNTGKQTKPANKSRRCCK